MVPETTPTKNALVRPDGDPTDVPHLARWAPLFVSPHGTGCRGRGWSSC